MDSNQKNELMEQTVEEIKIYIPKVRSAVINMIKLFHDGNVSGAANIFSSFSEGLMWLIDALLLTNSIQREWYAEVAVEEIHVILPGILTAWQNKDYTQISNMLEYEMLPILGQWNEQFKKINGVLH